MDRYTKQYFHLQNFCPLQRGLLSSRGLVSLGFATLKTHRDYDGPYSNGQMGPVESMLFSMQLLQSVAVGGSESMNSDYNEAELE